MAIRALIIDDESLARQRLRRLLSEHEDLEIVGEGADGGEAAALVLRLRPDLLFLDVNMPGLDGLSALEKIHADLPESLRPLVVFTTAYEEHALRAFELEGTDYLLKPVEDETLRRALRRVRRRMFQRGEQSATVAGSGGQAEGSAPAGAREAESPSPLQGGLAALRGNKILRLELDRVACITLEDTICFAHGAEGKHRLKPGLGELERRLPSPPWLRVSRSALVNLDWAEHLEPLFSGRYLITLKAPVNIRLEVSRRRAKQLRDLLGW